MPAGHFDFESFQAALDAVRKERDLTWRQVALQAGVSPSALTRLAQGSKPDVETIAQLTGWAGLQASRYFFSDRQPPKNADTMAEVAAVLRADPNLDKKAASRLQELLRLTYEMAAKPKVEDRG